MGEAEHINSIHCVFVRIHKDFISSKDGKPQSRAFLNTPKEGGNLSCDWCKYCSPNTSRELIGKQKKKDGTFKDHLSFFIWKFNVGQLRTECLPTQLVEHDPINYDEKNSDIPENRAHSIIIGEKPSNNAEFRVQLLKIGSWAIEPK